MLTLDELRQLGREWKELFPSIEFIGEIPVDESQFDDICHSIGKFINESWRDEEYAAALTVALVNIAYYSEERIGTGSFVEAALNKFGYPYVDQQIWEDNFGRKAEKVLSEYFGHKPKKGVAFRYVGPILRQAGVPARSVPAFAGFFRTLVSRYGWQFTNDDFERCRRSSGIQSTILNDFLESETGPRFCRDVARVLQNLKAGTLTKDEIKTLPGFRGELIKTLWDLVNAAPTRSDSIPLPRLVLDCEAQRVAIAFDDRGISEKRFEWSDQRSVRSTRHYLRIEDCAPLFHGKVHQPNHSTDFWKIPIEWRPNPTSWAAFRYGSETFETAKSPLSAGRWLMVLPDERELPDEYIHQDHGYLEGTFHRILDCTLPAGFEISEIDLTVETSAWSIPSLAFDPSKTILAHARNVFVETLPSIRVSNWKPGYSHIYRVYHLESNEKITRLEPNSDGVVNWQPSAPAQGRIRLEALGRSPRGFEPTELAYTLLPAGFRLDWPERLHSFDEPAIIRISSADANVEWESTEIRRKDSERWNVPVGIDTVSGRISIGAVGFSVAGPIHRLRVTSAAFRDDVFWKSAVDLRERIDIALSQQEVGTNLDFGISHGNNFKKIATWPVTRRASIETSTDAIRDGLSDLDLPHGRFAVRLGSGRVEVSNIAYVSEASIYSMLTEPPPFDGKTVLTELRELLPEMLFDVLESAWSIRTSPNPSFIVLERLFPDILHRRLKAIEFCSHVFDGNTLPSEDTIDPSLIALCRWYLTTRRLFDHGTPSSSEAASALEALPMDSSVIPFTRWRGMFDDLVERLRRIADFIGAIREWVQQCRAQKWALARKTTLGQSTGGDALTNGAEKYYHAIERKKPGGQNAIDWFNGALYAFDKAREATSDQVIRDIATALRVMVFYHCKRMDLLREANFETKNFAPCWNKLQNTLYCLCERSTVADSDSSLGLSDISPHPDDITIERNLYG